MRQQLPCRFMLWRYLRSWLYGPIRAVQSVRRGTTRYASRRASGGNAHRGRAGAARRHATTRERPAAAAKNMMIVKRLRRRRRRCARRHTSCGGGPEPHVATAPTVFRMWDHRACSAERRRNLLHSQAEFRPPRTPRLYNRSAIRRYRNNLFQIPPSVFLAARVDICVGGCFPSRLLRIRNPIVTPREPPASAVGPLRRAARSRTGNVRHTDRARERRASTRRHHRGGTSSPAAGS